jgi:hypothetical protein
MRARLVADRHLRCVHTRTLLITIPGAGRGRGCLVDPGQGRRLRRVPRVDMDYSVSHRRPASLRRGRPHTAYLLRPAGSDRPLGSAALCASVVCESELRCPGASAVTWVRGDATLTRAAGHEAASCAVPGRPHTADLLRPAGSDPPLGSAALCASVVHKSELRCPRRLTGHLRARDCAPQAG